MKKITCTALAALTATAVFAAENLINVSWGDKVNDKYPTSIDLICKDRSNLLLDVSAALSTSNAFVLGVRCHSTEDDFAMMHIDLNVRDGKHLQTIMNKLNQISGVLKVTRPAG